MAYISSSTLKGDVREYRRNKAKNLTPKRHMRSEELIEKAYHLLQQYENDQIKVHISDQKFMAEYIDTFGLGARDELLDKLQKECSFDIRKYLEETKLTWWQKAFHIKPKQIGYLSASKLQKKLDTYKKINAKLSHGFFHHGDLYRQQIQLEEDATFYAEKFLEGKIEVKPNDAPVLQQYWQIMGRTSNGEAIKNALQQLQNKHFTDNTKKIAKPHFSFAFWKDLRQTFSKARAKTANLGTYKPTPKQKQRFLTGAKVAGLAALLSFAGLFGFKSDKSNVGKSTNKIEQTARPKKAISDSRTIVLQSVKKQAELTENQKIWQNFYQTKNLILANTLKADAAQLNKDVQTQVAKGIFTLPDSVSSEQLVYAHLIYKAYGLSSPVETALRTTQKISAEQQKNIKQAIVTAGKYGYGVKKLAQTQAAKSGRKLGQKSAYNRASKSLKSAYNLSLKQIKALNHQR